MGIVTEMIENKVRKPRIHSLKGRKTVMERLPRQLRELIWGLTLRYTYLRVEHDYRSVASWARRMGEEWLHQEAMLVAQVEYYLEERETS